MPLFGSGCHDPNQEPGTAPRDSIYWFGDVSITLVPNTDLENDTEAVLAKAIEYGLGEGKTNFQLVLFSILNVVMLEVNIKNGIKVIRRTKVVPICKTTGIGYRNECDEDGDNSDEANPTSLLEQVCRKHPGFRISSVQ
jgi:hypothetical protein